MYQTTMTREHREIIENIDDVEMHTQYSGRGMYGHTCFGMVTNNPGSRGCGSA
jgi:hypothetical protein